MYKLYVYIYTYMESEKERHYVFSWYICQYVD